MSPAEFAPTSQQQLEWPKWGQYIETKGKAGEAPDLPEAVKLKQLYEPVAGRDIRGRARAHLARHAEDLCRRGVLDRHSSPACCSRSWSTTACATCPTQGIYNWDPGAHFGIYKPDGFWFDAGRRRLSCAAGAIRPSGEALRRRGSWILRHRREERPMLGYLVHRILIMIPTLIAISIVIFTIIHLPPGDYFSTYIAELQSQGEHANLAKIAFLKAQYGFDLPLWQQYLYLGRRAAARRHGVFVRLRPAGDQGGRRPAVPDLSRVVRDDRLHLCRRLPDRGLFGDAPVQPGDYAVDLSRLSRARDAELSAGAACWSISPMSISASRSAG